jgi:hypothetical protein
MAQMKLRSLVNRVPALLSRPAGWLVLAAIFLAADYLSGEAVAFPIAFALPVLLAAWNLRRRWAAGLAVMLPLLRLALTLIWHHTLWPSPSAGANLLIRVAVLLLLAAVTWRYRATLNEVRMLRGFLPICMHCRKIRDEHEQWLPPEIYLTRHSETKLSHGLCPECARKFYPEVFAAERPSARPAGSGPGDPGPGA